MFSHKGLEHLFQNPQAFLAAIALFIHQRLQVIALKLLCELGEGQENGRIPFADVVVRDCFINRNAQLIVANKVIARMKIRIADRPRRPLHSVITRYFSVCGGIIYLLYSKVKSDRIDCAVCCVLWGNIIIQK